MEEQPHDLVEGNICENMGHDINDIDEETLVVAIEHVRNIPF